jgi:cytochrome d ubiquinol oxidase subunit II
MDLNILWFILISVLFCGFFFLEGFDYGVGILIPILGKNDNERRVLINTIGPVWDGNEVWLLTAGGAMFAAFPNWYATMFSGFYLPLFLILIALIMRSVGFEFRSKVEAPLWRRTWDYIICIGSLLPAVLFGVAMANLLKGVPIDKNMEYTGGFFNLLSPFTLTAGVTALVFFLYHGTIYITLKATGRLYESAKKLSRKLGPLSLLLWILLIILAKVQTDIFSKPIAIVMLGIATIVGIVSFIMVNRNCFGKAIILNGLTIVATIAALFSGLYPRVMVSSTSASFNLTINNASSSPYTLKVMTIIALTLVPIVLLYQGWTYWVFRKRITTKDIEY